MANPLATLDDLLSELSTRFNQPLGPMPLLVTEQEATGWANQALFLLNLKIGLFINRVVINMVNIWQEYPLAAAATGIVGIKMVTVNNVGKPLERTDQADLMNQNPTNWNAIAGQPTKYYITDGIFTSIGLDKYYNSDSNTIEVYCVVRPAALDLLTRTNPLPTPYEYNLAIEAYMFFYAKVKRYDADALKLIALGKPAPEFYNFIADVKSSFDVQSGKQIKFLPRNSETDIYKP